MSSQPKDEIEAQEVEEQQALSLETIELLIVGAGGLGCELLKNACLLGFKNITIIDMDTIDISNLNRQFLFRDQDVGRPKAEVAAEFVRLFDKLQNMPDEFYEKFQLVISGLDSVEARRWLNSTLFRISKENGQVKPLIDGGTEGFKGQARLILLNAGAGSCFECSLSMFNKQVTYPLCTIANTPRLPEHCIEYASVLQWPKHFEGKKLDNDDPEHVTWIYKQALQRANDFNIQGVTYPLTQGVIKNIIPAIASTNAIVAATCVAEAYKLATGFPTYLDNYVTYSGSLGIYSYTFHLEQSPDCPVCSDNSMELEVNQSMKLENFLELLKNEPKLQLKDPSVTNGTKFLRMTNPKQLEELTRPNLQKPLKELMVHEDTLTVTDTSLANYVELTVKFNK